MRMSDIVSSLGLTAFPIAGMILFLSVFVGVILQVTGRKRRSELDDAAFLPLADDTAHSDTPTPRATHTDSRTPRPESHP